MRVGNVHHRAQRPASQPEKQFADCEKHGDRLNQEKLASPVFPGGIGGGGRGVVEDVAKVKEMLLCGGPLFPFHLAPLRYELLYRHGAANIVEKEPSEQG